MRRPITIGVIAIAAILALLMLRRCTGSGATTYQTATITRGPITQVQAAGSVAHMLTDHALRTGARQHVLSHPDG
jgi:hypothetical protein